MYASHVSLRDDYEVSCPELDIMVEATRSVAGTYGARMTGGGFGGCTINLVNEDAVDEFKTRVASTYYEKTRIEPEIYITEAAEGARRVG
jgi:galactokinase